MRRLRTDCVPARMQVAVIVETSIFHGRQILAGISRYLRSRRQWSILLETRELGHDPPPWLRRWRGDGIICRTSNRASAAALIDSGIPTVDLGDWYPRGALGLPNIRSDDRAVGKAAAEHFLDRGLRNFGFCGYADEDWVEERWKGFSGRLSDTRSLCARYQGGFHCSDYEALRKRGVAHPWEKEQALILDWLKLLPRPVGILAANDQRGQHLLDLCQRYGFAAPEQIAVLGIDNDKLTCEFCDPPLSSIPLDAERIGFEAAVLLERLFDHEACTDLNPLVPPLNVVTRQSTDSLAIDDSLVASAAKYIREHACEGATVRDVLRHVPLTRSSLERRFRKYFGRSPQAEIRHVQLQRVRQLLAETDLKLEQISEVTGFRHVEYMSFVYKRETGISPGRARRAQQARERAGPGLQQERHT